MSAPTNDQPTEERKADLGAHGLPAADGDAVEVESPDKQGSDKKRVPLVLGIRLARVLWRMLGWLALAANLLAWAWLLGASESLKEQALVSAIYIAAFSFLVAL
jgi:hypothetical protein